MYRKILREPLVIPAGVYIDSEPDRNHMTAGEISLDDYLRFLPDKYFNIIVLGQVGGQQQ